LAACSSCMPSYSFRSISSFSVQPDLLLSLHDALPISRPVEEILDREVVPRLDVQPAGEDRAPVAGLDLDPLLAGLEGGETRELRSEEHTSELQSRENLVCRLLLEKKKKKATI